MKPTDMKHSRYLYKEKWHEKKRERALGFIDYLGVDDVCEGREVS